MQLRIPGPTPIPPSVIDAASHQMVNHRGPEFVAMMRDVTTRLQACFKTTQDLLLLTASGTGSLEAAIVNTLSPGDRVLSVTIGSFGDRFAEIAEAHGAQVDRLRATPGTAADPAAVQHWLATHAPYKAVLVTHNETSTGVTNDVAAIAKVVHATEALLLVDAVSSVASIDLETDAWGLDVVTTCSQKGLMSPPGLAAVSMGPRAWQSYQSARMPRYYFDLGKAKRELEHWATPATPAVSIIFALQAALHQIDDEGLDNVFARHRRVSQRMRQGIKSLGLELLAAESCASDTVTAVKAPAGMHVATFLETLRADYGVVLAPGQASLAGKIFRIGHLGYVDDADVDEVLEAIGQALKSQSVLAGA